MADHLKKALRGDRAALTAPGYNAMVDAARAEQGRKFDQRRRPMPSVQRGTTVLVKNTTASPIRRFGVLALGSVLFGPSDNLASFLDEPCFEGVAPSAATRNYVVLQVPLGPGAIGEGIISGFTPARLQVSAEADAGGYNFADAAEAQGTNSLAVVESGQSEIVWRDAGTGGKFGLVRISNTPALTGASSALGVVTTPSTNGAATASYTVDVYGSDVDSLELPAVLTGETAIPNPASTKYWLGEVVSLTKTGDQWLIQKFLQTPAAYTVEANQICLRLWPSISDGISDPSNFMVDLADSSVQAHLDDGMNLNEAYVGFSFGSFSGIGTIGKELSVPVRYESGWNLCTPYSLSETFGTVRAAVVSGTVTQIASSQDTFSSPTGETVEPFAGYEIYATQEKTFGTDVYVIPGSGGNQQSVLGLTAYVQVNTYGGTSTALFSGLATIPSITGGVDSSFIPLVSCRARVLQTSVVNTSATANKLDPQVIVHQTIAAGGGSIGGTYTLQPTTVDLPASITVTAS